MLTIIGALIVLGLLVAVHEGGHFLAARMCGIGVEKFSIGFGKPIFKVNKGGVEYSLSWIPLGGYVKMKGDNPEKPDDDPDSFLNSPWWKRAIIAFSGPFTNLIFALVILILSFMFTQKISDHYPVVDQVNSYFEEYFQVDDRILKVNDEEVFGWFDTISKLKTNEENSILIMREGQEREINVPVEKIDDWANYSLIRPKILPIVGQVMPKSPAYYAGLESGDKITDVNNTAVTSWYDMNELIAENDKEVDLVIDRDGHTITKVLSKMELPNDTRKLIGITQHFPVNLEEKLSLSQALITGFSTTTNLVKLHYVSLYQMIKKPESFKNSIGGPVMIFSTGRDYVKKGIARSLQFVGYLNIVLMVMNLLPIPVLDGGHIMFSFIEGIRGKKLTLKTQMVLQQMGIFLLLSLMVYAFYSDFQGLITRYYTK